MIEIIDHDKINPFDLLKVYDKLKEQGITRAEIRPGNDCIWVSTGSSSRPINSYWIFRNSQLIDVQFD